MSVLRDLVITVGDILRVSGDLMRCRLEAEKKVIRRGTSRLMTRLVLGLTSLLLAAVGTGFFLYGAFVLLARATDSPGVAGLIIGFAMLLTAIAVILVGRIVLSRS
ncbi:MAG: hypothetical protein A2Y77_12240 [Planctomycetes bacterium RBG_13_62_9]|nr:MAG: hypothetical protein A2Y77_12240 [Planctomycetes bacterium RBG_13_62_9]